MKRSLQQFGNERRHNPAFDPCISNRGRECARPAEMVAQHDGYRLVVQRGRPRVRLFNRRG
jgi:hypothetical protein